MKKLYVTMLTIMLASSCTRLLQADNQITVNNWSSIPLSITMQASHKKDKKTRHDKETFILAPATTPFQKQVGGGINMQTNQADPITGALIHVVLATNGAGTHIFKYNGDIESTTISDATDPNNLRACLKTPIVEKN